MAASTKFFITAGLPPNENQTNTGSTDFYIAAGLVPDDVAAGGSSIPVFMNHYMNH